MADKVFKGTLSDLITGGGGMFDDIPVINFGAPEDEVRASIAKLPEKQRQDALNAWADTYVAKEREAGGIGQAVNNGVRALARGTPVGSWLDEANALTGAGLNAISGGYLGAPYEEGKAYQNAADRAYDKANPVTSTTLQVTGALGSAPLLPAAQVVRGGSLGAQMINAGVTGAGYGAAYGLGEGDNWSEGAGNAVKGAAIGGGVGAIAPAAAQGIGNLVEYGMNAVKGVPQGAQGFERGAVNRVSRAMTDDGLTTVPAYQSRMNPLGREGMLLDAGDNLQNQAGAIANQPGQGQSTLFNRLDAREAGARGRIEQAADAALGQPANMRQTVNQLMETRSAEAAPLYERAMGQRPVWNDRIQQFIDDPISREGLRRGVEIQRLEALAQGRPLSATDRAVVGFDEAFNPVHGEVPNMRSLDAIKRGLDNILEEYRDPATNRLALDQRGRAIEMTRGAYVRELDRLNPDYAAARSNWQGHSQTLDAFKEGQEVFGRATRRDDLAQKWRDMNVTEREATRIGARDAIRETMDNASSAGADAGDTAARRLFNRVAAQDKLDIIAQPGGADLIRGRVAAENTFDASRNAITGNSKTAPRQAAQKEFPNSTEPVLKSGGDSSLYGRVEQGVMKLANALTGGVLNERNARIASDAADMLSRQGAQRDDIARALISYGQQRQMSQQGREAIERVARQLLTGGRQSAVAVGAD